MRMARSCQGRPLHAPAKERVSSSVKWHVGDGDGDGEVEGKKNE